MPISKVGTGYVPIKPDTEGFGAELERGLDREGTPAASRSGGKMAQATKAAFVAGVALIGKSVMDFGGFEKQMNEVFTLLPGISGAAMDQMSQQVEDFAVRFGVLPQEVVPALYQSLSAGIPADNVFAFIETAQQLARGGVTDLTTAVDGLSSVVNAYGPSILSAQQASDLMFTTVKLGKTTIADLSSSIFQVTPTAAGLGVAFSDVTAALAAMTLQGVPTSVATTQLRQLLVELSKQGSAAAGTFEKLSGKSFRDFVAGGGNVQDALQIMERGAADAGVSISDMFGSVEAGSAALSLTGGGTEAFSKALTGMGDSAGATQAAFDQMNQGLGATLDRLKARFSVTLLNIGEQIAPTIQHIGDGLAMLFELFSKLPAPMQAVVVLLGTTAAGLFAFAKPIMNGITLFSKLGGVFSTLAANPWVIVLAGLVTVTVLLIKNWDKVKATLSAVWGWMRQAGQAIAGFFVNLWRGATGAVSAMWGRLTSFFRDWWPELLGIVTGGIGLIVGEIVRNWDAIYAKVSGVASAIAGGVAAAWNAVWSVVTSVGGKVVGFITGIPEAVAKAFTTLAGIITAPFAAAFAAVKAAWNATIGGFGFKTPDWLPLLGGKSFTIPRMAGGGVLTGPTLFLGGEYPGASSNAEIVAPQNIMRQTVVEAIQSVGGTRAAGAPTTINVERMEVRSDMDIYRVARELDRLRTREGRAQGLPAMAST